MVNSIEKSELKGKSKKRKLIRIVLIILFVIFVIPLIFSKQLIDIGNPYITGLVRLNPLYILKTFIVVNFL